jgi:hypothetical protein
VNNRWLSVVVASLLLLYAAEAAPHTVHHGLDHDSAPDCPVLAISDQTNGEPANDAGPALLPLPPFTRAVPILELVHPDKSFYEVLRTRAPPFSLPA